MLRSKFCATKGEKKQFIVRQLPSNGIIGFHVPLPAIRLNRKAVLKPLQLHPAECTLRYTRCTIHHLSQAPSAWVASRRVHLIPPVFPLPRERKRKTCENLSFCCRARFKEELQALASPRCRCCAGCGRDNDYDNKTFAERVGDIKLSRAVQ